MQIVRESLSYLMSLINDSTEHSSVLLMEGARQVGKTSLIKNIIAHADTKAKYETIHINLEVDKIFRDELDQTNSFTEFSNLLVLRYGFSPTVPTLLFIDEAQESVKLGGYVRSMKEEWKSTRSILSGSSMTRLFAADVRIPVGRIIRFILSPFSFQEYLEARKKNILLEALSEFSQTRSVPRLIHEELLKELDLYLLVGGLPEVVTTFCNGGDYKLLRRSLFLDQEEDFLRIEGLAKRHLFRDALRGISTHMGTPSKLTHISENAADARKIVNQLESWHLINRLELRGINVTTDFSPKRYTYDLGIAHDTRAAPFPRLSLMHTLSPVLRTDLGGLLENFVFNQIHSYQLGRLALSGWKKNNKELVEVDFVIQRESVIPLECKASLKLSSRSYQYLKTYLELSGLSTGFLVSAAPYEERREQGKCLINIPLYLCNYETMVALFDNAD